MKKVFSPSLPLASLPPPPTGSKGEGSCVMHESYTEEFLIREGLE